MNNYHSILNKIILVTWKGSDAESGEVLISWLTPQFVDIQSAIWTGIELQRKPIKGRGLDLSQLWLNWESLSWQFEKGHLDSSKTKSHSLDYPKNQDFSIFVEISIESLDIDSLKKDISTCRDIMISISIALNCRDPQA